MRREQNIGNQNPKHHDDHQKKYISKCWGEEADFEWRIWRGLMYPHHHHPSLHHIMVITFFRVYSLSIHPSIHPSNPPSIHLFLIIMLMIISVHRFPHFLSHSSLLFFSHLVIRSSASHLRLGWVPTSSWWEGVSYFCSSSSSSPPAPFLFSRFMSVTNGGSIEPIDMRIHSIISSWAEVSWWSSSPLSSSWWFYAIPSSSLSPPLVFPQLPSESSLNSCHAMDPPWLRATHIHSLIISPSQKL